MEFITPVEPCGNAPLIGHAHQMMLMGSCFAQNIGQLLNDYKFRCLANPFGVLYNPLSIAEALRQITAGKEYGSADLFLYQGCYHSLMHHGSFSSEKEGEVLGRINANIRQARELCPQLDYLMVTFGTSWVYTYREDGRIAGNCHKLPASCFDRRRLEVGEIVSAYQQLIMEFGISNAKCKWIFTVSPIRHAKDGMHGNQLSKATLLLAIDRLASLFPGQIIYFPSYEIMMDELRDYRFYADDMLHPSPMAIEYIWQRFTDTFFDARTRQAMKEVEEINKALCHKPFHQESEAYQQFLTQIVSKIERLKEKYPTLDFEKEQEQCLIQLKK